jgi:DNA/RNA-binding domain of Phe-tRNA-synthetase-like protein
MIVIDGAVQNTFEISIGIAEIQGVKQQKDTELSKEIAEVEAKLKLTYTIEEVKDLRIVRMQRDFFWHMGVDPTKVRPASEALLRRILLNKGLPRVSPIVDAYNLASVKTLLTFSAFDLEQIDPPLLVRFSKEGEVVSLIGSRMKELTGRELVLTDSSKILCVYVHGDVDETKVTDSMEDLLLVAYGIPGLSKEEIRDGMKVASQYIMQFSGGKVVKADVYP